jgi:D-aminoacyl-tRNA deacylase
MLPSYQTEGRDDEDVARMVKLACEATGTDSVYVHRKSMKKPEERRITAIIQSLGYETVTSADLEPLSES